jgi:RND family efflux transporter MFP subunit
MKRILILTALAAGLACGRHEAPELPAPPAAKVRLAGPVQDTGSGWIAVTLSAARKATLSTRMAASVRKVLVSEGQRVAAGALLVSLSDEDLQAGLKAAQAAEAAAAAQHRRIEALLKQDAAIPAEMDEAATRLAQARAAVAQVRANIGYTQIRAPFAGVIQTRMVDEGAFVGPGTPLVQLEGQGALELDGSLSEAEAKGLRIGLRLPFESDGKSGLAEISALSTGGDPVSHRGTIRARILQGGPVLRTGSFARLKLPQGPVPGPAEVSVPRSALVQRGELSGVFVARDGKAELHWLSLGDAQGAQVPVRAGLSAGDQVIAQPGGLRDGQPVEVLR